MSVADLRVALADRLAPLSVDFQVSPYILASPTPPAIQIFPTDTTYDLVMSRGLDEIHMTVQAMVQLTTDIGAQQKLDGLMASSGATSVKGLLDGNGTDSTLGGLVNTFTINTMAGPSLATNNGIPLLVTEWEVILYPNGE